MTTPIQVDSLEDPRISPYRSLKDRDVAREGARFIAEGEHVVRRLLQSDYPVESVLLAARRVAEMAPLVPDHVPVYAVPDALVQHVVGFKFHSGVIACGRRLPPRTLEAAMSSLPAGRATTIAVCPDMNNTENLGVIMRIVAGFGVDALVLGEQSCDPFYRQAIRVSMGAVFSLNLVRSEDIVRDLRRLRSEWGFERIATVLDESAEPLHEARRGRPRVAMLFGNEAQGLSPRVLGVCDRRITIPMKLGTDSLNVSIAAAVFLYHFCLRHDDDA